MAHIRQSRPDSGLGFQLKFLETFKLFHLRSEAARAAARSSTTTDAGPASPPGDQIAFVGSLISTGARRNPAAGGTNPGI